MAGRNVSHSDQWWETAPAHVLRCTASLKSTGKQCRRKAAPGTNVCNQHGALIPAVQASAAKRIRMSVDDAVQRLHQMLDDDAVEARDKIKILHDLLDRGGLGATSQVLVGVGPIDPIEKLFTSLLSAPGALADRPVVTGKVIYPDPAQAAIDAREEGPSLAELLGRENGSSQDDSVVDDEAEDLIGELPPHTVRVEGTLSDKPPGPLKTDLERVAAMRAAGLW